MPEEGKQGYGVTLGERQPIREKSSNKVAFKRG